MFFYNHGIYHLIFVLLKTCQGQRIAVTLYSFPGAHIAEPLPEVTRPGNGAGRASPIPEIDRLVPEVVRPESGSADAALGSCDVGPLVVVESTGRNRRYGLCDPRQQ